jgi:hypothetical protein
MVSECANPRCREPFIYYRHGKLFSVPRGTAPVTRATIEHFWLCQSCAAWLSKCVMGEIPLWCRASPLETFCSLSMSFEIDKAA